MTTYFCDGLREVTVVNGVVRLEFHRLEAVQRGQNRELQPVVEFTVALPVQGFLQALGRPGKRPPTLRRARPHPACGLRRSRRARTNSGQVAELLMI
jgi:hypothetical protein